MDQWYQHFYIVFNTFFDNDSNGIDDDEVDDEHGYDENGDSENDDIAALECDITEGEVYDAIRMLKNGKAAGSDLITGEFFFKISAKHIVPFLVRYFNNSNNNNNNNNNNKNKFKKIRIISSQLVGSDCSAAV